MASTKYYRKGRWQYSSDGYNTSYRDCPVCGEQIDARAITRHLNRHAKAGEVERREFNDQILFVLNGITVYVKD